LTVHVHHHDTYPLPRTARVVVAGAPHHVTQRGHDRQTTFLDDRVRIRYLRFLRIEGERYGLSVLGFCLMPNHVHLIVVPRTPKSMARAVGRTHYAYTHFFHTAHDHSGHLWQNRYYFTPLDQDHLVAALAYVDLNPVRAGHVATPEDYIWSSARAPVSGCDSAGILDLNWWKQSGLADEWKERIAAGVDDSVVAELREATVSGQPPWSVTVDGQR
jgi:putative transposase